MTKRPNDTREAQDAFRSMVGGTECYPNDPQHPDPSYDIDSETCSTTHDGSSSVDAPNQ